MLCALAHGRGYVVQRGVGEPGGKPARGPIRVGGGAGAFARHVGINGFAGDGHQQLLIRNFRFDAPIPSRGIDQSASPGKIWPGSLHSVTQLLVEPWRLSDPTDLMPNLRGTYRQCGASASTT